MTDDKFKSYIATLRDPLSSREAMNSSLAAIEAAWGRSATPLFIKLQWFCNVLRELRAVIEHVGADPMKRTQQLAQLATILERTKDEAEQPVPGFP